MANSWKTTHHDGFESRRALKKDDRLPSSVVSGIGLSTWSLLTKKEIPACHLLPQSIEDEIPYLFRNYSSSHLLEQRSAASTVIEDRNAEDDRLPPVDGGRRAWLFMLGAFMTEGFMWGFPLTFGIYQEYYQSHPPFEGNKYLTIVGTLCTGISCLGSPLVTPFTIRYPRYQRHMIWAGWSICIMALIASSFATQLWHLIVTQGLFYGIGFLFIYYPLLSMLNEWWIERRGFAYGLMFGSAGICGLGLPFIIEIMLHKYGHAITLRASALGIGLIVGPNLLLLRGRNPTEKQTTFKFDTSVFRTPPFLAISLSNTFQGLVFFLPSIFISSYASTIGLPNAQGALVLSLLNLAQVFGQMGMGYLSDYTSPYIPMGLSSLVSAIAVLFVWGFCKTLTPLLIFGVIYGLLAGGYGVLYCRFVTTLTDDRATGLWLYSIFEFERGVGSILGGLMAGLLTKQASDSGYGSGKYGTLILVIGSAFLVSSIGGLGWFFRVAPKHK